MVQVQGEYQSGSSLLREARRVPPFTVSRPDDGFYTSAMSFPVATGDPGESGAEPRLQLTFVLIVIVEIVTIVALYWFGHHFGQI